MKNSSNKLQLLFWWLPTILWIGWLFIASGGVFSGMYTSRIIIPLLRKLFPNADPHLLQSLHLCIRKGAHMFNYYVLALAVWIGLWKGTSKITKRPLWQIGAITLAICGATAVLEELRQAFTTNSRVGSGVDVGFDVIGSTLAILTLIGLKKLFKQRHQLFQRDGNKPFN